LKRNRKPSNKGGGKFTNELADSPKSVVPFVAKENALAAFSQAVLLPYVLLHQPNFPPKARLPKLFLLATPAPY